jgi:hypothetical protein
VENYRRESQAEIVEIKGKSCTAWNSALSKRSFCQFKFSINDKKSQVVSFYMFNYGCFTIDSLVPNGIYKLQISDSAVKKLPKANIIAIIPRIHQEPPNEKKMIAKKIEINPINDHFIVLLVLRSRLISLSQTFLFWTVSILVISVN